MQIRIIPLGGIHQSLKVVSMGNKPQKKLFVVAVVATAVGCWWLL